MMNILTEYAKGSGGLAGPICTGLICTGQYYNNQFKLKLL